MATAAAAARRRRKQQEEACKLTSSTNTASVGASSGTSTEASRNGLGTLESAHHACRRWGVVGTQALLLGGPGALLLSFVEQVGLVVFGEAAGLEPAGTLALLVGLCAHRSLQEVVELGTLLDRDPLGHAVLPAVALLVETLLAPRLGGVRQGHGPLLVVFHVDEVPLLVSHACKSCGAMQS
jgi:hypothetical protein